MGTLRWLGPGVMGIAASTPDGMILDVIEAITPGSGDVGRYLDRLPRDSNVLVPFVVNPILAGMLERRGFVCVEVEHYLRAAR